MSTGSRPEDGRTIPTWFAHLPVLMADWNEIVPHLAHWHGWSTVSADSSEALRQHSQAHADDLVTGHDHQSAVDR